jgi:transposase
MSEKRRQYTDEFIKDAVNLALKSHSLAATARELGIPVGTLNNWIIKLKQSSPSKTKPDSINDIATLIEENRRLHKELAVAREEKEILKKAAAYFAQHQK